MTLAAAEPPDADTDLSNNRGLNLPKTWLITLSVLAIAVMIIGGATGFIHHSAIGHRECRTEVYRRSQQQTDTTKDHSAPARCRNHGNDADYCKNGSGGDEPITSQKVTSRSLM